MDSLKLTGLWKKKTKAGDTYLTGPLSYYTQLTLFRNDRKRSEKDPDYVAYLVPRENGQEGATRPEQSDDL